ncbi:hypothetical protein BTH_I0629 [Burkholderia thailandensis E264]|uniref:Uncharacterized protein n=1 Tax=Burkholderia thailandensis (strain ATCC 700388 / DSM 13276 / CCUG 48851 / CIP 106301 / E264) TaxID=271848 RepID=Q2T0W3_BURTA|nr:hypothetical protein BTH_I0629 [Burkholderia thailandensis E264]
MTVTIFSFDGPRCFDTMRAVRILYRRAADYLGGDSAAPHAR